MQLDNGAARTQANSGDPIRVMVVDDSAVVRGLITRMLEEDPGVLVVASVSNGQMAISALERHAVEVAVLDIEMPVMDGLTALPKLLQIDPDLKVIMASTLTLRNADISLKALEAGAADYIAKPSSSRDIAGGAGDFRRDLVGKVKALGNNRRSHPRRGGSMARPGTPVAPRPAPPPVAPRPTPGSSLLKPTGPLTLRPGTPEVPEVLAIGSSTGGPQALFALLGAMRGGSVRQPILITQHMPATFTTILAEHIHRISGWDAAEGKDGEVVRGGRVYVAPGDFHMVVEMRGADKVIRLNKNPPENFCRPSVDPMLRSIAQAWGKRVLVTILTGMGSDGLKGGQAVIAAGGSVIAQDEPTSVVWGMPGAVAQAGICSAVLPLPDIAPYILKLATRRG